MYDEIDPALACEMTQEAIGSYSLHRATRPGGDSMKCIFLTFVELVSRNRNEGPWVWIDY